MKIKPMTNYKKIEASFSHLNNKTIKSITGLEIDSEKVRIETECGFVVVLQHVQDCCEDVLLNDFDGDASDVLGGYVIQAEEVSNAQGSAVNAESYTWTFYKIETNKGGLWMRWLGESNGCYSEEVCVTFYQLEV
ncbi:hypothetical protein QX249_13555 [Vibrio parahaemolyticus]|uniref:DUF7448 domain-containing protein n=1 Tax=Vibrio parahaemolyticus TaxID=670 RepID=A0AAW8Q054_VIBPH|nr:hypothetical protein [Vibrio parahaemolyticus]MDS1821679.1 hypothetical protein [Vibrio parahaemolyticus]